MWRPRPPGLAWLLRHELRLIGRSFGGVRSWLMAILALLLAILFHFAAWLAMRTGAVDVLLARAPTMLALLTAFLLLFVLGAAFGLAVTTFFERGDADLLLSSPVPFSTVFAVRAAAVGLASVGTMALFLAPLANVGPFAGHPGTLLGYPLLVSVGLGCAALAFAGTLALVRTLGLRRGRVAAQLLGALVGAGLLIAMQLGPVVSGEERGVRMKRLAVEAIDASSPLLWPVRAFLGDPWALAYVALPCIALFVLVTRLGAPRFAQALQDAPAALARPRGARPVRERAFRTGLARIIVVKELLLLARDPALLAKVLLQVLYLVPLLIVLVRRTQPPELLAAALVAMGASIAGTLAWIAVSGEEAPDLVLSAPLGVERLRWLKVGAVALPVMALLSPFVAWYAFLSPATGAIVALFVAVGVASSGVVQVWSARLGAGRDLRQRHKQNVLVAFADSFSAFGWAGACYGALRGSAWMAAGIGVGLLAPVVAWIAGWSRRRADSR